MKAKAATEVVKGTAATEATVAAKTATEAVKGCGSIPPRCSMADGQPCDSEGSCRQLPASPASVAMKATKAKAATEVADIETKTATEVVKGTLLQKDSNTNSRAADPLGIHRTALENSGGFGSGSPHRASWRCEGQRWVATRQTHTTHNTHTHTHTTHNTHTQHTQELSMGVGGWWGRGPESLHTICFCMISVTLAGSIFKWLHRNNGFVSSLGRKFNFVRLQQPVILLLAAVRVVLSRVRFLVQKHFSEKGAQNELSVGALTAHTAAQMK